MQPRTRQLNAWIRSIHSMTFSKLKQMHCSNHLQSGSLLVQWPFTRIHHRPSSLVQKQPKRLVAEVHVVWVGVTAVKLYVVHTPVCERLCVQLQIELTSGKPSTRLCTEIFVDPKFQSQPVSLKPDVLSLLIRRRKFFAFGRLYM